MRRLHAVLRVDPTNREAQLRLGNAFFRMEQYAESARFYRSVLDADPEDHDARSGLWAVRLQEAAYSDEAKAAVRVEIDAWLAGGPRSVSRRLAAYRGYDMLHDDTASRDLLVRLLRERLDGDAREEVAQDAFEAALGEEDQ